MSKKKRNTKKVKNHQKQSTKRVQKKEKQSKEKKKTNWRDIAFILTFLLIGGVYLNQKSKPKKEFIFGNIHYVLSKQAKKNLSQPQIKVLSQTIKTAYKLLVKEFGTKNIMMKKRHICYITIIIPSNNQGIHAGFMAFSKWINTKKKLTTIGLRIEAINKVETMFHEMMHLYLQKMRWRSTSFAEGHAYAKSQINFPNKGRSTITESFINHKKIMNYMNSPWDFEQNQNIKEALPPIFSKLIYIKWEKSWQRYLNARPGFLKQFYTLLTPKKSDWNFNFTKKNLVKTAVKVDPNFVNWMKKDGISIQNIQSRKMLQAFIWRRRLIVFNINIQVDKGSGLTIAHLTSSKILDKPIYLAFKQNGIKMAVPLSKNAPKMFISKKVKKEVFQSKFLKVYLGSTEIPLQR